VISLVVPIYNEELLIPRLHEEISSVMRSTAERWEVLYVNDGSNDRSRDKLLGLRQADPHVAVVDLSRNWGHQPAVTAGMENARGAAVVLMDGDLQDPPSVIPRLIDAWKSGADVVVAERRSRAESGIRRFLFLSFYRVLGLLSDYPIPLNAGIFGLMDRKVVDSIARLPESNRYLPGLRAWVGFRTTIVLYERAERAGGSPKQTLGRLLKYGLDAIFSFSYKPLRLCLSIGLLVAALAIMSGITLIVLRILGAGIFRNNVVLGYTSTMVSILLLSGVQLISLGILGEYIGRIYDEVKHRPLYIVSKFWSATNECVDAPNN
jgi:glycosyltransferase involved in cell wall biosynthesis